MTKKTILVTGATGQQGGSAAQHLLAHGFLVRAFVRDPASAAVRRLAQAGAELAIGDMDDRDSLDAAMQGAYGVFSIQPSLIAPDFAENELQRGLNVADAARAIGVRHFVYASVGSANRNTGVAHWEIKWQIEQYIRTVGLPFTVLRPTMFMENYADATYGLTADHSVLPTIPSNAIVQHIALTDIGAFAALAFGNPTDYVGKAIELAGDELTTDQIITAITRAIRRPIPGLSASRMPTSKASGRAEHADGLVRFGGWHADIPALRRLYPRLMAFDTWLTQGGSALIEKALNGPRASHT